ncbi:MAG: HK97 family phage prohead protease [Pseudomonadota bacterium]
MSNATITRRATGVPTSVNREARTFVATLASDAAIDGVRLDLDGLTVPDGVPVQLDHRTGALDTVGRVIRTWREGGALVGEIRLSSDKTLDPLMDRIADGTITGVSVGFKVTEWGAGMTVRTARRATLVELSITSFPADPAATVRSGIMDDETVTLPTAEEAPEVPPRAERRRRAKEIRTICRNAGLPADFADEAIDEGWDDATFNARAMAQMQTRAAATIRATHNTETRDNPDAFRRAATGAMVAHMGGDEPDGLAREIAGAGWVGLHREVCRNAGISTAGLSGEEIIRRALSTSDMPLISDPANNQTMRAAYEAATSPTSQLFASRTASDFNTHKEVLVDWTTLGMNAINELGAYKSSYIADGDEEYRLFTIGGRTGVSRQLYINGGAALGNLGRQLGRRLAADVNDRRVAFLTQSTAAGPTMKNGTTVFHADRGNIEALDTTSVTTVIDGALAARAKMPKRKGAGDVMVGATPRYWLVSTGFEPTAMRAIAQVSPSTAGEVNPLSGKLETIAEPRLEDDGTSYLVAGPGSFDGAVEVRLAGAPGPVTESRWNFENDAYEVKVRLDLGFGWLDWRSWTRLDHTA